MSKIVRIHAREVFDSRGKPTVEVEVQCSGARPGRAIVPSGASTGQFEALELRDDDPHRLDGTGVRTAVEHVNGEIADMLVGHDAADQPDVDATLCELDGTSNKSRLGANAILGVSLAIAYAAAEALGVALVEHLGNLWRRLPLTPSPFPQGEGENKSQRRRTTELGAEPRMPLPMVNMISGGLHAGGNLDLQDVLILPIGASSYREALDWIIAVYRRLGALLSDAGYEGYLVGDEGGFGPRLKSNKDAMRFVVRAIEAAGLTPGQDVSLGLDVASTHFYDAEDRVYRFDSIETTTLDPAQMIDRLTAWADEFPVISIEDGLAEEDWEGWKQLTDRLGDRVQLIGDDFFVTNIERLNRGIEAGAANSVLIKVNQIGTLTETLQTMRRALDADYLPVVSARSGETEDATIADLAVATGAGQIKIGSIARSERLAKYNQLLRLEERFGDTYIGGRIFDWCASCEP